jgi:nucleoside-diphosphate-sugar epimerase
VVLLDGGALLIQPVAAVDIARAALAVLSSPTAAGRVYNIAGPEGMTTHRYYETVAEIVGSGLRVLSLPSSPWMAAFPDRAPFAQHRLYSTAALADDTGFTPGISVREMLTDTIRAAQETSSARPYSPTPEEANLMERLEAREAELRALFGGE